VSDETPALRFAYLTAPGPIRFAAPEIAKPDCRTVNHPRLFARPFASVSRGRQPRVRIHATAGEARKGRP